MSREGEVGPLAILGRGSVGPFGESSQGAYSSFLNESSGIRVRQYGGEPASVAPVAAAVEEQLELLLAEGREYRRLDRTVHLGMLAGRQAIREAGLSTDDIARCAINISSSRGATGLLEQSHTSFLEAGGVRVPVLTSPVTTSGNISSAVAADLGSAGTVFSHSVTCSSGLHALGNGMAWLNSGMVDFFLAGGSEAPLTSFTVAQMKALRVYASNFDLEYPCRPCAEAPASSTMVLGEGAACFLLAKHPGCYSPLAWMTGFGAGMEELSSLTSLSKEGVALQRSMNQAIQRAGRSQQVDLVIVHAPGTLSGDRAEVNALRAIFGDRIPPVVSLKWGVGHTLGAAGALAVDLAVSILHGQEWTDFPYASVFGKQEVRRPINTILVNAVGFGGNAASVLLQRAPEEARRSTGA